MPMKRTSARIRCLPCRPWLLALAWLLTGPWASGAAYGQGARDIVVGQLLSQDPALADAARELHRGAQACAQAIDAGSLQGRRLRIVTADDGGDPSRALERVQEMLARHHIAALLTPMGVRSNARLLPWASEAGLAVLAPFGTGAMSAQAARWPSAFFLRATPSTEALRLATQLQTVNVARVGIVYADDDLGREALILFEEALASVGMAQAVSLPLRAGAAAPAGVVAELRRQEVQAVLLGTVGEQTITMLRALAQGKASPAIAPYALSTAATPAVLAGAGPAAQGLVLSQVLPPPQASEQPVARAYREALRQQPGAGLATYTGFEGCVAVQVLAQVLRSYPDTTNRSGLLQALQRSRELDLGGWTIDLSDRQRPGSRYTDLVRIGPDGRWAR